MIIDSVIFLHELVAHHPVALVIPSADLHVAWVEEELAFALALVLNPSLSWHGEELSFGVFLHLQKLKT